MKYIAFQLKDRVSFIKVVKKGIEITKKCRNKGSIQIAGHLAGKEIALVEIRKDRLPLQAIYAKIDYCCYPI